MNLEQRTLLNEVKKYDDSNNKKSLYPMLVIYNEMPSYTRVSYSMDYIWFNEIPEQLQNKDLYQMRL